MTNADDQGTERDDDIVRASIHPAIGVARLGDAEDEFYVGPEVVHPESQPGTYRTADGALKREAAQFRIYGYDAAGEVVRELTADDAEIVWTVHLANRKADWFRFITAMDIPETADLTLVRRNAKVTGPARAELVIDPGQRSITGKNTGGGPEHTFDTGMFKDVAVPLGELRTDDAGRLRVLGAHGRSGSPSGAPPFVPSDPDTFNNADDFYDDTADGPVTATVLVGGQSIPVEGAWVITAPPNYAPDIVGWRTMYDLMVDVAVASGMMPVPPTTSFTDDVLPQLQRLSNLQWVNKGFAAMFGPGRPMDFENPELVERLASTDVVFRELRRTLLHAFRPYMTSVNEPRLWPWIYGDDFGGSLFGESPRTMLALPAVQQLHLQRWVDGTFVDDWDPERTNPHTLSDVPLVEQPHMLDRAALHFCLADAFHPGCEMTWPMRHATMYERPFRIRHRETPEPPDQYGATIGQPQILAPDGPLHAQGPGDITRWMGLPWQGDTAYCRSGYDPDYDPYLPTFWPARVPNTVLTEQDYEIVVDTSRPREERLAAFDRRASWYRSIDTAPDIVKRMEKMIAEFGAQGIVEARPGVPDDPDFPATIYVENVPAHRLADFQNAADMATAAVAAAPAGRATRLAQAGWGDEEHLAAARSLRMRRQRD